MTIRLTENDKAWNKIFESQPLLTEIERQGFVYVTSSDLNLIGSRQARLLAKQDTKESRPKIFRDNHLSLLAVENGKYIIFKDVLSRTYFPISQMVSDIEVEEYHITTNFSEYDTIDSGIISTEAQAIDYAYLVSLIKTITNEPQLLQTVRGRYGSEDFTITIPPHNHSLEISGVQIEIDAGFESPEKIYLFEAKKGMPNDFNIRQLYFPFKDWSCKSIKEIIPIFFVYTNGLFYFFQFKFLEGYGNLELIQKRCFTINEPIKQDVNLSNLLQSIGLVTEPAVTFPQADDLNKVIDIVTNFTSGVTNKEEIVDFFSFENRQGDYYADAAIYLGLLKRHPTKSSEFELTRTGEFLTKYQMRAQRNLLLLKQLIKTPCFNEILHIFITKNYEVSQLNGDLLAPIIHRYHNNLNGSTLTRRALTVRSWLNWMKSNMNFE